MLVSVCCEEHVTVEHTEDCSFYVCIKCRLPADGRRVLESEGVASAVIQPAIAS